MLPATADAISCPSCGKKYAIKSDLMGKQVRCKCGSVLEVPPSFLTAVAPPALLPIPGLNDLPPPMAPLSRPALEIDADDLYDLVEEKILVPVRPVAALPPTREFIPISVPGLIDDADCPSCDQRLQAGAIICTHCGFNLKTGQKPNRPAPATTKSAAAAFAGMARPHKKVIAEDKKIELVKVLLPLVALLAVLGIAVASYTLLIKNHKSAAAPKGNDAQVLAWMNDPGAKEIHDWFKQDPDRMAGEYNTNQAIAKADELQQIGAKQVLAFGARMTRSLAVELPDDPDKRKALFVWENKFAVEHYYPPDKDVGQKYLLLKLQ
jgi:hypothetical protein